MEVEPINSVAVIGMACRLPGGIDSPQQLWEALCRGDDLITEIPAERWDAGEFFDPEPGVPGRSQSKWGAFLEDVAGFDFDFFGIDEREAATIDPQHRLLLENSWEAMEHAGLTPERLRGSLTGVFIGLNQSDYQFIASESRDIEGPYGFRGSAYGMASGRIAHTLGLRGPALTVDAADSSGLLSVHMACRSLIDGESDLAFAGGAFVMLDPRRFAAETAQGHLSPTGRCRAFDIAADGYALGEGSAVVLLKRLSDAIADDDRILAVVSGTAANQSDPAADASAPSPTGQAALYRAALNDAGVDAGSVGMVEAHGAGAPVGDSLEFTSLTEVYGVGASCALTSIKTNLGHTQSASGPLALMKAVLALQHAVIPPNLHFTRLPAQLAKDDTDLFVARELTEWPDTHQSPRRAAVSSFGASGTNVHAILEQAPEAGAAVAHRDGAAATAARPLFLLSSTSSDELRRTAERLADWVQINNDIALPDLAYTLALRRAHRPVRTAVVANNQRDLIDALRAVAAGDSSSRKALEHNDRGPVWVFAGPGSRWGEAGAQLLTAEPVFAEMVARIEPTIAHESGFSVAEAISAPDTINGIDQSLPVLFTVQVALAHALREYGVRPGAVIGHSLGEVAAAVVAGALSLEDGLRVICRSSRLLSRVAGSGAMASVELPAKQVLSELTMHRIKDVAVAIVASPQTTLVSGATQTVQELLTGWRKRGVTGHEIAAEVALHSSEVDPILGELKEALAELKPGQAEIPFYSATQFDPREQAVCGSRYWIDNVRRTARFAAAARAALEDGYRVFAELAPQPLLIEALEQTADSVDTPLVALASVTDAQGLSGFIGALHSAGAAVDFSVLYPSGRLVDAPLPTWSHRRPWLELDDTNVSRRVGSGLVPVHPLLGQHVHLREELERHVWQAQVGTAEQPWLADYGIRDVPVFPGAGCCEMALAAAHAVLGESAEVYDLQFERPMVSGERTTVNAMASVKSPHLVDFAATQEHSVKPELLISAVLRVAKDELPVVHDIPSLLSAHPLREDGALLRKQLAQRGIQVGSTFASLSAIYTAEETATALAELAPARQVRSHEEAFVVHPALLEACFQAVTAHPRVRATSAEAFAYPMSVRRLRAHEAVGDARYCYARVASADSTGVEADLDVLGSDGRVLLALEGLRFGASASGDGQGRILDERLLAIKWQKRQSPDPAHDDAGAWLLISGAANDVLAPSLADALKRRGAQCRTVIWGKDTDLAGRPPELEDDLRLRGFAGVVVLAEPASGGAEDQPQLAGRKHVQHLAHIFRALSETPDGSPQLFVVTRNARTVIAGDRANLEQAGTRGLVRAIGAEHPHLHAVQIDTDAATDVGLLAAQLLSGSDEDETAWRSGHWYTARLSVAPLTPDERKVVLADHQHDGIALQIRTPGDLDTLELVTSERVPPGPGLVEVAVSASGINFADVGLVTGHVAAAEEGQPELGRDFAGVVTAVGPGVSEHHVGDHVGGIANGSWRTFITCDADIAVPLPEGLSIRQAAALTTPYATAWHALHDLAGIAAGDRVLIHAATEATGQAAIAIARAANAEIYATASSDQCRQRLRDSGIPHVYDCRSAELADAVRRDTHGVGIDIALSSATGAVRRAIIEQLSAGGRFVEIGTRNTNADAGWSSRPLTQNFSLYGVDLGALSKTHPKRVRDVVENVYRSVTLGQLQMPESLSYPMTDVTSAIRHMTDAQRTDQPVLEFPHQGHTKVVIPPAQVSVFRGDGAYIVTGGLGYLGLVMAEQMARAGCGRIVLSSRSQPTPEAMESIERMRESGIEIEVERGDVAEADSARRIVDAATATGLPVRGVLHLAAAAEEVPLSRLTDEHIARGWAPRVEGAWNVHVATIGQPLDWFCSFSPASEMVGSSECGPNDAANSWLSAFAMWRRAHGLPGHTISWGSWAKPGQAAADDSILPDEGAHVLNTLLRHDRSYTGYAPVTPTSRLTAAAQRGPFASALRSVGKVTPGSMKLRAELDGLAHDEWPVRLRRLLSEQLSVILRRKVDPDRRLVEYGVDSLGALELLTRVETETGVRLTPSDIATATIRDLAALLSKRLE